MPTLGGALEFTHTNTHKLQSQERELEYTHPHTLCSHWEGTRVHLDTQTYTLVNAGVPLDNMSRLDEISCWARLTEKKTHTHTLSNFQAENKGNFETLF